MNDLEAVNQLQSFSLALQGLLAAIIAILLAQSSVQIGDVLIGFYFLPALVIVFWPARASYSWTIFFWFLLGLLHDVISNGPFGVWSLSYLLAYIVLGGGVPVKSRFSAAFLRFIICISVMTIVSFLAADIVSGAAFPNIAGVLSSLAFVTVLFPIVYFSLILLGVRQPSLIAKKGG